MRRFTLSGLVAVTAIAVSAMGARADVITSMTPTCLNSGCTEVAFTLNAISPENSPSGAWYLYDFELALSGGWAFDTGTAGFDFFEIRDNDTTYGAGDVNLGIDPYFMAGLDNTLPLEIQEPVVFEVLFSSVGTRWTDISFAGDFREFNEIPLGSPESFEGQVTPEPATLLLLGTGLLGIAGVARRRKNLHQDGEEEL